MPAIGDSWATGSWDANAWATNAWADSGGSSPATLEDMNTALVAYLPTLRAAATTPLIDTTSLLTAKIRVWRNADTNTDTNTVIAKALS